MSVCLVGFGFAGLTILSKAEARLPNIVFIFADDLGYADVGCYGHPYAVTPAIDRLAEEGTRFTQFYVTGVTCNPSRTGLMTGLFPARFPKYAADFGFGDRITVTDLLKQRGYRTGHFGKWHMGPDSTETAGTYSLDTIEVIGGSHDDPEGRDAELFKAADRFIRKHAYEPFYVNIWGHSTHFPVHVAPELAEEFKGLKVDRKDFSPTMQKKFDECLQIGAELDAAMQQYLADVYSFDLNVDRILKTIDELGLREDTLVVVSSDHGPAPVLLGAKKTFRQYSENMLGYAGEFQGGKHNQYEGGVRVPFIIRWPGQVQAGRVDSDSVLSFIDWLPTLCAIAGVEELPDQLDGEDVSDVWLGKSRNRSEPLFWKTSSSSSSPAIREGKWKLHLNTRRGQEIELYDLLLDPSESQNVAGQNPEVVALLSAKVKAWVAELPKSYEKNKK